MVLWRDINEPSIIASKYGKSTFFDATKTDHHKTLIQRWNAFGIEWVRSIDRRHTLKVDVGARKLRGDEFKVVVH